MTTLLKYRPEGTVLVVGDIMLDRYWQGPTERISPEAPVPVVRVAEETERVGGAANVAANVASLGARAVLVGGTGNDAAAARLDDICTALGIETRFLRNPALATTVKLRVMSQHQQLLRLDFESDAGEFDPAELDAVFRERLRDAQAIVLSDYAKGFLRNSSALIAAANAADIPVIVDPKTNDYSRYAGATLVTPNLGEFENCVGRCADDAMLLERARHLCERHNIGALLITRGERGMVLIEHGQPPMVLSADARDVFDVTGAGDTVCAALATGIAAGATMRDAVRLANIAAGIVVGKSGTATVSFEEVELALAGGAEAAVTGATVDELIPAIEVARARGDRIVMTNGCFDILHAGHVTYLQQAKALGTRLLVAVNSDASVTRLKGAGRPVHRLADRMAVLAALGCVDWVVSFDDDTPAALVERVSPHMLVKGGDYAVEEIAGGEHVLQSGGQVMTLPLVEGLSTTGIVQKISNVDAGNRQ